MQKELSLVSNSPSRKEVKTISQAHVDKLLKKKKKTPNNSFYSKFYIFSIKYILFIVKQK